MKAVLQNLRNGATEIAEAPVPTAGPGEIVIATRRSLISAGTERMLVDFGRAGWLSKARQQPDKVRQVLSRMRTDGVGATLDAVRAKLDEPLAMGYSSAGVVAAIGSDVHGFAIGDRVASNGRHADYAAVPQNLCARIPDGVDDEQAAFTVLGAIALQGVRLAAPTLGETMVVTGLGLVGLLTVQLLRANGCRVLGIDFDPARLELARELGAEAVHGGDADTVLAAAAQMTRGRGVDGVLLCAATRSSEPVHLAASMCRKRGRIVLVGVTGLELSRADFFEKELTFQVSCSYGPGRYDPAYEDKGQDYPYGFVRWTEQRNFEAFLDLLAQGQVNVAGLVSHRFALADAARAYELLAGGESSLGIMLEYDAAGEANAGDDRIDLAARAPVAGSGFAVIGAGGYAGKVLLPAIVAAGADLRVVCSASGVTAAQAAKRFDAPVATSDPQQVLDSADVQAVVIATRHDSHARFTVDALSAGKHVFVEKPLAMNAAELADVVAAKADGQQVMVGFNRRFAPHVVRLKALLAARSQPAAFVMQVNAGAIPAEHWTQDAAIGGGRIIGEACHFIDLLRFLAGAAVEQVSVAAMADAALATPADTVSITLRFANGHLGTVHYFANGNARLPKERLEAYCGGSVIVMDNFRDMRGYGWPGFRRERLRRQDKGNAACMAAFVAAIRDGGEAPIPFDELVEVHETTFAVAEAVRSV